MSYSTKIVNLGFANIGNVKITFNDNSYQTRSIISIDSGAADSPSVGTYFDQDSNRTPIEIEVLDNKWSISDLPAEIQYPNENIGEITNVGIGNDNVIWVIYLDTEYPN